MPTSGWRSLAVVFLLLSALAGLSFALAKQESSFKVEITTEDGRPLPPIGNLALVGIEQTLVARVTPPLESVELEWSISPQSIRTYEHSVQDPGKHKPIPLSAVDRKGPKFSYFWTTPRDGAEVSVRARKGAEMVSARAVFDCRLPKDANRLLYSFADDDPRRSPNGLTQSFAITRDHRRWHLGMKMSTGEQPVYAVLADAGNKLVWGDLGYRDDPARLFDLDYNGSALLGWHGNALDAHRAWRRTFHVPCLDTTMPPGALPIPGYLLRVPEAKSADQSRLYGYVRVGEFQNLDQLGRDAVHPWHNRSHTGISKTNRETLMDNHGKSPPAKDDLFWRWHSVVEEVRRALGPDQALVTEVYPGSGASVADASAIYIAFDRKVSFNAPPANKLQLHPGLLTVNGKPATAIDDVGGDQHRFVMFRLSGFPVPADGSVKFELADTPGIKGGTWTFNLTKSPAASDVPQSFRKQAEQAFTAAQERQRTEDIGRLLARLAAPDADDLWIGHLFRMHKVPASMGVPILIGLLEHPSDQVKGRAIQTLQYLYADSAALAVPKLSRLLHDPQREWWVRERAALALGQFSSQPQDAVRDLVASLENKAASESVNLGSVEALGRLGPKAASALPPLRKYLASNHPLTQRVAYFAIAQIVNAPAPAIADLKKLEFVDWNGDDGGFAVHRALQQLGDKGAVAVPALVETYRRNPPAYVRGAVIETLGKVGGGVPAARILIAALPARWGGPGDMLDERFLSDRAIDTLAQMPTSDPQVVPLFAEALSHADPVVRFQAAKTLRRYGPSAEPAAAALIEAIKKSDGKTDPYEVGAYLSALRAIGPGAKSVSNTLVELLNERSKLYEGQDPFWAHFIRMYILVTLADIEVPAAAKPYILDLLNNSDKTTAHGYAAAARALRPEMTEGIAGLQRALKPEFPDFPMCFDDFAMALGNEDASCRLEALRALARMGPRAKAALPSILEIADQQPDRASPVPPWNKEARQALQAIRGAE